MKKYIFLLLIIVTALGTSSCSSLSIKSDYDHMVNFSQYKAYEIRSNVSGLNDIDKSRVINAVKQQLEAKGMNESKSPDVVITLKETTEKISNVETVSSGGWGWRNTGFSDTTVNTYDQGTLIVNFIDAHNQQVVWEGIGSGLNVDNVKAKAKQIPIIIEKLLTNYPPGQSDRKK